MPDRDFTEVLLLNIHALLAAACWQLASPKIQPSLETAALLTAAYVVVGLLQTPAYLKIDSSATLEDGLLATLLFAALLFPAAYLGSRFDPRHLPVLSRAFGGRGWIEELAQRLPWTLALAVVAFAVNVVMSGLFSWAWVPPTAQDYVARFSIFDKVITALSSGIWEETVFRLFLISAGAALLGRRRVAALSANLLFAAMHLVFQNPPYNLPALAVVFTIGLIYTKCYLDKGLESAMVCHAVMNLLTMTVGMLL